MTANRNSKYILFFYISYFVQSIIKGRTWHLSLKRGYGTHQWILNIHPSRFLCLNEEPSLDCVHAYWIQPKKAWFTVIAICTQVYIFPFHPMIECKDLATPPPKEGIQSIWREKGCIFVLKYEVLGATEFLMYFFPLHSNLRVTSLVFGISTWSWPESR